MKKIIFLFIFSLMCNISYAQFLQFMEKVRIESLHEEFIEDIKNKQIVEFDYKNRYNNKGNIELHVNYEYRNKIGSIQFDVYNNFEKIYGGVKIWYKLRQDDFYELCTTLRKEGKIDGSNQYKGIKLYNVQARSWLHDKLGEWDEITLGFCQVELNHNILNSIMLSLTFDDYMIDFMEKNNVDYLRIPYKEKKYSIYLIDELPYKINAFKQLYWMATIAKFTKSEYERFIKL